MATPNEKIATSLGALRRLRAGGRRIFSAKELSRVHRGRLLEHGYLQRVIDGWLISASPTSQPGESTPWLTAFWEFCGLYCEARFDTNWHLSAEQSLLLHIGTTVIPTQVIVYSPKAQNNKIELLHDTCVYDIRETQPPPAEDLTVLDNLRVFSLEAALTRVPDAFFAAKPLEAEIALNSVRDASGILRMLLRGGHSVVAGRLAGAFRRIGRVNLADEIVAAMSAAEHNIPQSDPFVAAPWVGRRVGAGEAPIVGRLHGLWALTRGTVIAAFPRAPGLPHDRDAYLHQVDEIYVTDAYHSLSIEGYQVTAELIERVRTGAWRPETNDEDQRSRSAMAARGYWQAFTAVKRGVAAVLEGAPAAELARDSHPEWYRELFQPSVAAGIAAPAALAGYRHDFVYLKTSRYVPPRWEAVRDAMPTLFDLMAAEPEACVRAVLGHWLIGYVHPYMDGNGRVARFLMNVILASGGYPWTVIRLEDRARYLDALDRASLAQDIEPLAQLIAHRVQGWPTYESLKAGNGLTWRNPSPPVRVTAAPPSAAAAASSPFLGKSCDHTGPMVTPMATREQQDYKDMCVFVLDEAVQRGLRVRPPIRIREVQWDGGSSQIITSDHLVKISSNNSHVEITIPHGDAKDPQWRFLTKARVENAVTELAAQTT